MPLTHTLSLHIIDDSPFSNTLMWTDEMIVVGDKEIDAYRESEVNIKINHWAWAEKRAHKLHTEFEYFLII